MASTSTQALVVTRRQRMTTGLDHRLAGPDLWVCGQNGIENGIGDLSGDLVRDDLPTPIPK